MSPDLLFCNPSGSDTYRFLRNDDSAIADKYRKRIETWYGRYKSLLDKQFRDKFCRQPEQHYWELVVAHTIETNTDLKLGWTRKQPKQAPTPDFITSYGKHCVWVEATTTGHGDSRKPSSVPALPDPVPLDEVNSDFDEPSVGGSERRKLGLRIQNSLRTKAKKLLKLNGSGSNIVAIGGGTISSAQWHNNIFDWRDVASFFYPFEPPRLINWDGAPVPPTIEVEFQKIGATDPVVKGFAYRQVPYEHVAGVLFSTHGIAGLSSLMEPCVWWVENPYCSNSLVLRPAFAGLDRIVVHAARRQIEYLPPNK